MIKRLFDIVFSFFTLIFLIPAFLIIAFFIKIDSRGAVFYRGIRVGRRGKLFKMLKFRTMIDNAEKMGGLTTADKDPRITKVGQFLRRYKIDELPQLINVLAGQMSVVGPRPEVEKHVNCYSDEEKIILTVVPGMTDYSSVKFFNLGEQVGKVGAENADEVFIRKIRPEKNRLRILYVKNHSFWGDIKIIIKTLCAIIKS